MNERLINLVESMKVRHGVDGAVARLCKALGCTKCSLYRWMQKGTPNGHVALLLALACGASESEAFKIGMECHRRRKPGQNGFTKKKKDLSNSVKTDAGSEGVKNG